MKKILTPLFLYSSLSMPAYGICFDAINSEQVLKYFINEKTLFVFSRKVRDEEKKVPFSEMEESVFVFEKNPDVVVYFRKVNLFLEDSQTKEKIPVSLVCDLDYIEVNDQNLIYKKKEEKSVEERKAENVF